VASAVSNCAPSLIVSLAVQGRELFFWISLSAALAAAKGNHLGGALRRASGADFRPERCAARRLPTW